MNHTTTEVQPLDDCYKAFLYGGTFCLTVAIVVVLIHAFLRSYTSADGSGIALLLLLSLGGMFVNRGLSGRTRIRTGVRA